MASTCTSETTWTTTFPSSRWTEPPLPTPASCLSCRAIPHLCAAPSLDRGIRSRLWWRERFFFGGLHEIRSTKQRCRKSRGNQKRFPYEPGQDQRRRSDRYHLRHDAGHPRGPRREEGGFGPCARQSSKRYSGSGVTRSRCAGHLAFQDERDVRAEQQ